MTAFLGLLATGQTIALLTGGIDLSVAGVVTMTNIVATSLMLGRNDRIAPAVPCCLVIAARASPPVQSLSGLKARCVLLDLGRSRRLQCQAQFSLSFASGATKTTKVRTPVRGW